MRRALEAFFRRSSRLVFLLVLLPIIGFTVGFELPRTYQAQASLWAEYRYSVIGATGPESDLQATPAQTQATALNELLQTRAFALAVANQAHLPDTLSSDVRTDPSLRDDALVQAISGRVQVAAQGTNLFTITYQDKSAQIAQKVVAATINSYGQQSEGFSVIEAQKLLDAYQGQLPQAEKDATSATQAEQQYINQHPSVAPADFANDPQYSLLQAKAQQAQTTLLGIRSEIATIQQEIAVASGGPSSLFQVLDNPTVPARPLSRTRTLLLAAGGGLALALLACAIYLALLVRRDDGLYTPAEVQRATELRVLLQLPVLPTSTISASRRELALVGPREPASRRLQAPRAELRP